MKKSFKKRGQKFIRKFSRASIKASEGGKEHIKENLIERVAHVKNIRLLVFEWVLLITALILLAVTQAFWSRDSYSEETFSDGGTYTEATLGKITSMNPLFATTSSEKTLSRLLFANLSEIDYSGHPGLGLADSIKSNEEGKVWTVKLRDNLKWSDGMPITNEDVLYTIDLIKNPAVTSIYDSNLSGVKVSENENGEIIFTLPTTYADFISALNFPIVPKHDLDDTDPKNLLEDSFSLNPVTSGAFTLNAIQSQPNTNEQIIYLSGNPHYYKGAPMLDSFAIHNYLEPSEIINALKSGKVTATAELLHTDASNVLSNQIQEKTTSLHSGAYIFFNTSRPIINDTNIRSAIREGIDINELRDIASDTLPLDYPFLTSQIMLDSYPQIPKYNPVASTQVLAEKDLSTPINIATINKGYLPIIANSLSEQLKKLGFTVDVSTYEESQEFITNIISNRNYDILIYEIELGTDPDLLAYYHSSRATASGLNLSNYRNPITDDLLLAARSTIDSKLRNVKYTSFLNYWVNDVPAIGIYQTNLTYFYNRNARSFSEDLHLVTALDRFSDVISWSTNKTIKNRTP